MQVVPLQAVENQAVKVTLGEQSCQINIYQKRTGLFVDLYVDDVLVIAGTLALNRNKLVRSTYLGFVGDLAFADTQGNDDPTYTGLGARFQLVYLEAADLAS